MAAAGAACAPLDTMYRSYGFAGPRKLPAAATAAAAALPPSPMHPLGSTHSAILLYWVQVSRCAMCCPLYWIPTSVCRSLRNASLHDTAAHYCCTVLCCGFVGVSVKIGARLKFSVVVLKVESEKRIAPRYNLCCTRYHPHLNHRDMSSRSVYCSAPSAGRRSVFGGGYFRETRNTP